MFMCVTNHWSKYKKSVQIMFFEGYKEIALCLAQLLMEIMNIMRGLI